MSLDSPVRLVERQQWLEPFESAAQNAIATAFHQGGALGRHIQNALHGTWLGHPLHPVLTDVPLGAWTVTLVADILEASGRKHMARGADLSLTIGLAGAGCAALAGATDWHVTDGRARRIGIVHGTLNLVSVGFYTASLIARKRRNRIAGRAWALAGFMVCTAAAYLGGNMVYGKQIGVNHTAGDDLPSEWTPVMDEHELPDSKPVAKTVNHVRVLLTRLNGQISCISEVCSHLGGPLAEGEVRDETVTCPWHGSRFALRDGSVIDGPATHPQPCFQTRVIEGRIEVKAGNQQ